MRIQYASLEITGERFPIITRN